MNINIIIVDILNKKTISFYFYVYCNTYRIYIISWPGSSWSLKDKNDRLKDRSIVLIVHQLTRSRKHEIEG